MNAPATLLSRRALALATSTSSTVCVSCRRSLLRQFSSSARRPSAAPSYQSYSLPQTRTPVNPPPPPKRAAQDAGGNTMAQPPLPKVHETRPPKQEGRAATAVDDQGREPPAGKSGNTQVANESKETSAALAAAAASQTSRPTQTSATESTSSFASQEPTTPSTSTNTSAAPKPRPSRLRTPRKAAMKLTPAAVAHLRALLDQPDPKLIKVGVRNRGCSGLAYHLEYVDGAGAFDEAVEQDGVRVLIDSKALFSIIGSEMDWVEDKLSQRFVFRNPNIKEQCGCGESFMV